MKKIKKSLVSTLFCVVVATSAVAAEDLDGNDVHVNGYSTHKLQQPSYRLNFFSLIDNTKNYVTLDSGQYQQTVASVREEITQLLTELQSSRSKNLDDQVALIAQKLSDIPYLGLGAMGEGDWQSNSLVYLGGALHLQQDPVYRLDGLNCQTFVQVAMALLHSNDLKQFDQNIIKISYGAAGNPSGEIVHYYNRNHFPEGDFNPVNEKQGFFADVTSDGALKIYARSLSEIITRQDWFAFQQPVNIVRVLSDSNGDEMVRHFKDDYSKLNYPHFDSEEVTVSYLPKESLTTKQADGSYQPNQEIFNKIPTPAVIEIVRDPKKWNIKNLIGSDLSISHMGLIYRQTFQKGDVIYQKVYCQMDEQKQKICQVSPVTCTENQCNILMFAQATSAYPNAYYWYQDGNNYVCSPNKPADDVRYTSCNRVERLPLSEYITRKQYTASPFMDTETIVGIHVEKLVYQ